MNEVKYNNKRYRCIKPRAQDMPIYCGRWEYFYERKNKWVEVLNYEIKSRLNRIVDKQKKKKKL